MHATALVALVRSGDRVARETSADAAEAVRAGDVEPSTVIGLQGEQVPVRKLLAPQVAVAPAEANAVPVSVTTVGVGGRISADIGVVVEAEVDVHLVHTQTLGQRYDACPQFRHGGRSRCSAASHRRRRWPECVFQALHGAVGIDVHRSVSIRKLALGAATSSRNGRGRIDTSLTPRRHG
jgi:hypothetical protein